MKIIVISLVLVSWLLSPSIVFSASVEKAQMMSEHGLKGEAKKELINVVFGKANSTSKDKKHLAFSPSSLILASNFLPLNYAVSSQGATCFIALNTKI
jgi:hypothetical protein